RRMAALAADGLGMMRHPHNEIEYRALARQADDIEGPLAGLRRRAESLEARTLSLWEGFAEGSSSPTVEAFGRAMLAQARGHDGEARSILQDMIRNESFLADMSDEAVMLRNVAEMTIGMDSQGRIDRTLRILRGLVDCRGAIWEDEDYRLEHGYADSDSINL